MGLFTFSAQLIASLQTKGQQKIILSQGDPWKTSVRPMLGGEETDLKPTARSDLLYTDWTREWLEMFPTLK